MYVDGEGWLVQLHLLLFHDTQILYPIGNTSPLMIYVWENMHDKGCVQETKNFEKCIPVTLGHMRVKQQTFMTESTKIDHVVQNNLRFFVFALS